MSESSNSPVLPLISRRTALKLLGVGATGGMLGYSRFSKPQPTIFQQDTLDLPRQLNQQKSVVVVGAGLAGLACAYELCQRGFKVTLLERSPQLGGKIASWPIQVGNQTFMMEHGFHGFFPQYYNLKSLVEELNIRDNFVSLESYAVVFRDGKYNPEVFRPNHSAFPWNIVDLAIASPNWLHWGINLVKPKHWQVFQAIGGFEIPKSFERLDHLSVQEWVENDFPQGLYDLYFLPFAKSSLNAPDVLSVGELMQFFHFYFFGNPEGLAFNGTRQDMGTSLVQPIALAIERSGGAIVTEATVSSINWQQSQINSLSYQLPNAQSDVPFWVNRSVGTGEESSQSSIIEYYGAGDAVFAVTSTEGKAILTTFEQELYEIVPSLKEATMLHRELVNQKNFSGYPPGSYAERPETCTGVPNLIFAGDWVKMPFPCGLMERAISSGLLAANTILGQEGLQRRSLFSVNPEGILKI